MGASRWRRDEAMATRRVARAVDERGKRTEVTGAEPGMWDGLDEVRKTNTSLDEALTRST